MQLYIPAVAIVVIVTVWILGRYFSKRYAVDVEVESLKRSRKIWLPDDTRHLSIFDLYLCVSCEVVHAAEVCPRCASAVVLPLNRVVQSTLALELPVKRAKTANNVIPLPLARPSGEFQGVGGLE